MRHLLTLFLCLPLVLAVPGPGERQEPSPFSANSDYRTAPASPHSAGTPPPRPIRPLNVPNEEAYTTSFVVYPDEDPAQAPLAHYVESVARLDGKSKIRKVEQPLEHPRTKAERLSQAREQAQFTASLHGVVAQGAGPGGRRDKNLATMLDSNARGSEGSVPVERIQGNLMTPDAQGMKGSLFPRPVTDADTRVTTPISQNSEDRKAVRFGDAGFRHAAASARWNSDRDLPQTAPSRNAFASDRVISVSSDPQARPGAGRRQSPTRNALNSVYEKLRALKHDEPISQPPSPMGIQAHGPSSAASGSPFDLDLLRARLGSSLDQTRWTGPRGSSQNTQPSSPFASDQIKPEAAHDMELMPFRKWSAQQALPYIGMSEVKDLHDANPAEESHFKQGLSLLDGMDWNKQWTERFGWLGRNRMPNPSPTRAFTQYGPIGHNRPTSTKFKDNPNDPKKPLYSITLTGKQMRIKAWQEMGSMLPPGLMSRSRKLFGVHARSFYKNLDPYWHTMIHPINYLGNMLRDEDGAVILENAIYEKYYKGLTERTHESLKDWTVRSKKPDATLDEVLGPDHALHGPFDHDWRRDEKPFEILNPLEVDLDKFEVFRVMSKAVGLKPIE